MIDFESFKLIKLQEGVWLLKYNVLSTCCFKSIKHSKIIKQKEKPDLDEIRNQWYKL